MSERLCTGAHSTLAHSPHAFSEHSSLGALAFQLAPPTCSSRACCLRRAITSAAALRAAASSRSSCSLSACEVCAVWEWAGVPNIVACPFPCHAAMCSRTPRAHASTHICTYRLGPACMLACKLASTEELSITCTELDSTKQSKMQEPVPTSLTNLHEHANDAHTNEQHLYKHTHI